ncbi:MAG: hypothetical protein MI724_19615, partial [Spirochaetales bacterium]|nr:hypothetical protein [Spirochaetales bacterium]
MNKSRALAPLSRWAAWAGTHPWSVLLVASAITLVMLIGVSLLRLDMTFYSIMPQSSRQVEDLKRITEEYPFASTIVVVVDGRAVSRDDATRTVKEAIDEMAATFASDEFSSAVDGVYSAIDRQFVRDYGLLLVEQKDLERFRTIHADPDLVPFLTALNDDLEREYSGDGDALEDDEAQLVTWVRGVEGILEGLSHAIEGDGVDGEAIEATLDDYLIGETYFLSRAEDMGLLFLNPTYTIDDLAPLVTETNRIEERVKKIAAAHGLEAGLTGFTVVGR